MALTHAPRSIGPAVQALCDRIRPGAAPPVYLRVDPDPDCVALSCFANVQRKVDREGGSTQVGWAIWIWPRVFIEAEHHAVYAPPGGAPWRDITPGDQAVRRRLFLPDDSATYGDADRGAWRDNIRVALADDPLVVEMFTCMEARTRVWRAEPAVSSAQSLAAFGDLQAAELAQHFVQLRLAMKYTRPNDPCFCGGGRRFRACHGRAARPPSS